MSTLWQASLEAVESATDSALLTLVGHTQSSYRHLHVSKKLLLHMSYDMKTQLTRLKPIETLCRLSKLLNQNNFLFGVCHT